MRMIDIGDIIIAQQDNMPRWGQLGCNGFIVLDSKQQVVSPQTAAFLEVRSRAFRDVEQHLDKVLGYEASRTDTRTHARTSDTQ